MPDYLGIGESMGANRSVLVNMFQGAGVVFIDE